MSKRRIIFIIIIVILAVLAGTFFYFLKLVSRPFNSSAPRPFFVTTGEGVKEIAQNLKKENLIGSTSIFETYIYLRKYGDNLKAGEYLLGGSMSLSEIVNKLVGGKVSNETIITVVEGWNSKEIGAYLEEKGVISQADFLRAKSATNLVELGITKQYGFLVDKPVTADLEGYLFPDTYRIYKNSTAGQIVQKMLDNFDKKLTPDLRAEIKSQGKTIFEIVTMASILEKEVKSPNDQKMAADVFYKRLKAGIALQSDATVNFVTTKKTTRPTSEDLEVDSLYNTYQHKGLPPGPISNPGVEAIKAAIYPTANDYYYFLTKDDGTAVFSKTFEEHNANKARYLK